MAEGDPLIREQKEKFCRECGAASNARAEVNPTCGECQLPPPGIFAGAAPNGKSKPAAALFAIFPGGVGSIGFVWALSAGGVFIAVLGLYSLVFGPYRRHCLPCHER